MFKFFANIFGYVLNFIYGIVNNYGVAIILFTILLKVIMLPISIKQQKTMKKSAKIQGQVKEIQDKYKNDPTRMNQEVMDLYKKENMSPFSRMFKLNLTNYFSYFNVLFSKQTAYLHETCRARIN